MQLWHEPAVALAVLDALAGHPSLRYLMLHDRDQDNRGAHTAASFAALGALLSCNSSLEVLDLSYSRLGDTHLRPLFEALPQNTRLRTLSIPGNDLSAAFARDVMLPAVRANTSLRTLNALSGLEGEEESVRYFLSEAQAVVWRRSATP